MLLQELLVGDIAPNHLRRDSIETSRSPDLRGLKFWKGTQLERQRNWKKDSMLNSWGLVVSLCGCRGLAVRLSCEKTLSSWFSAEFVSKQNTYLLNWLNATNSTSKRQICTRQSTALKTCNPNCYTTCHETNNSKIWSIDSNDTHEHISFLPSWSLLPGSCLSSDTEVSQSSPSWSQVFSELKHKVVAVATTDAMITMATAEFSDRIVVNSCDTCLKPVHIQKYSKHMSASIRVFVTHGSGMFQLLYIPPPS